MVWFLPAGSMSFTGFQRRAQEVVIEGRLKPG